MAPDQHLEKRTDPGTGDPEPVPTEEGEAIERPAALLRLAHMIQGTLQEARSMDVDEGGRERLSDIYNRTVTELRELVSEGLQDELDDVAVTPFDEDAPSSGELRIAQAQLVGWLQGLLQGIQASVASRQLASQQQQPGQPSGPGGGQYL